MRYLYFEGSLRPRWSKSVFLEYFRIVALVDWDLNWVLRAIPWVFLTIRFPSILDCLSLKLFFDPTRNSDLPNGFTDSLLLKSSTLSRSSSGSILCFLTVFSGAFLGFRVNSISSSYSFFITLITGLLWAFYWYFFEIFENLSSSLKLIADVSVGSLMNDFPWSMADSNITYLSSEASDSL